MNRFRMFFVQTSTRPPTHGPKGHQTWKQNNQFPTKSHDELKDNSIIKQLSEKTPLLQINNKRV